MLYRSARGRRKGRKKLWLFVIFIAAVLLFFEMRIKPISASVSEIQAKALAVELINESVYTSLEELDISPDELETVVYSDDRKVASVNSNTVLTNKLKNAVTLKIQESISNIKNRRVDIPLSLIFGWDVVIGNEPSVPINISLSGNVQSDFESSFEEGGVNQTVHKLSMKVSADINIIMPFGSSSATVETSVLIGETVIVGDVPSVSVYSDKEI